MPALLDAGRLHRAASTIHRANELCPAEYADSTPALVEVLVELGLEARARSLAESTLARPEVADSVKSATRQALARARAPGGPAGEARLELGLQALREGNHAAARRAFDRAIVELEAARGEAVKLRVGGDAGGAAATLAWSTDEQRIALAGARGLRVVNVANLVEQARWEGAETTGAAWSRDGRTLAAVGPDNLIRFYDTSSWREVRRLELPAEGIEFWGDDLLTWGGGSGSVLWDLEDLQRRISYPEQRLIRSPDGRTIASFGYLELQLLDAATGAHRRTIMPSNERFDSSSGASDAVFCADGKRLMTSYASQSAWYAVRSWDVETARPLGSGIPTCLHCSLALSPRCDVIAEARMDESTVLVELASGREHTLDERNGSGATMAFSPSAANLAVSDSRGALRLYEVPSGRGLGRLESPWARVEAITCAGRPGTLSLASSGGRIERVGLGDGALAAKVLDPSAGVASPSDGGSLAAFTDRLGNLRVARVADGVELLRVPGSPSNPLVRVAFSPDERFLAAVDSSATLSLYRIPEQALVSRSKAEWYGVDGLAFSQDGKVLGVSARERLVFLESATGRELLRTALRERTVGALGLGDEGRFLRVSSSGKETRFSTCTPPALETCADPATAAGLPGASETFPFAVSRDLPRFAFAPSAAEVILYDWRRQRILSRTKIDAPATSLTFCDGGELLAVAQDDGAVALVDDQGWRGSLGVLRGIDAGYIRSSGGKIDLLGPDAEKVRPFLFCQIGPRSYPFELCEERFREPGLFTQLLSHVPAAHVPAAHVPAAHAG